MLFRFKNALKTIFEIDISLIFKFWLLNINRIFNNPSNSTNLFLVMYIQHYKLLNGIEFFIVVFFTVFNEMSEKKIFFYLFLTVCQ